jgi:hypothetical protein
MHPQVAIAWYAVSSYPAQHARMRLKRALRMACNVVESPGVMATAINTPTQCLTYMMAEMAIQTLQSDETTSTLRTVLFSLPVVLAGQQLGRHGGC